MTNQFDIDDVWSVRKYWIKFPNAEKGQWAWRLHHAEIPFGLLVITHPRLEDVKRFNFEDSRELETGGFQGEVVEEGCDSPTTYEAILARLGTIGFREAFEQTRRFTVEVRSCGVMGHVFFDDVDGSVTINNMPMSDSVQYQEALDIVKAANQSEKVFSALPQFAGGLQSTDFVIREVGVEERYLEEIDLPHGTTLLRLKGFPTLEK